MSRTKQEGAVLISSAFLLMRSSSYKYPDKFTNFFGPRDCVHIMQHVQPYNCRRICTQAEASQSALLPLFVTNS